MPDFERLLREYGIPYVRSGHKHATAGWVNVCCPFCGDRNYHLGLSLTGFAAHCWRCGTHKVTDVIQALLGVSASRARELIRKYEDGPAARELARRAEPHVVTRKLRFPKPHSAQLEPAYRDYLAARGFDPDRLQHDWFIEQTGPKSYLDGIDYSYRILIPIPWDGRIVSFQSRDITNRHPQRYLACPKARERIPHKTIVYGQFFRNWRHRCKIIVVEGVTDVWRLGEAAVATFGIQFTIDQVLVLSQLADSFVISYDNEPQAQKQARLLSAKLRALGRSAVVIPPPGKDPADLTDKEAEEFIKEVF